MSLSTQTLDLYDDLGLSQLRGIFENTPSFVKTASISPREEVAKLPTEAFALHALTKEGSRIRRFPIHSAADTWLSCAYFEKNAHKLPRQAARIAATHLKTACDKFNLDASPLIEKLASAETPVSNLYVEDMDVKRKEQLPEIHEQAGTQYALPGRYPLFNEEFVKKAAAYFVDYFGQFEPADRHAYANAVLSRSDELSVTLSGTELATLKKVAGSGYGDRVDAQLAVRRRFTENDAHLAALDKIASVKESATPAQFAALLDRWDKDSGMGKNYGRYVLDPYQATFDRQFEKEAGYTWEDSQSGVSLTGKELEKAAEDKYDKIRGYFGETLANSLKKHASEIFESLPSDAKLTIARIVKGTL